MSAFLSAEGHRLLQDALERSELCCPPRPEGWIYTFLAPLLDWVEALVLYRATKRRMAQDALENQLRRELREERNHRIALEHKLNLLMEYSAPDQEAILVPGVEAHWELKRK